MAQFSMRIVDADFYLAKPIQNVDVCFSQFQQHETGRVPVVRVFGSTANGQKTCLHLHRTFPYIYVQVPERDASERFAKQFAMSLDLAIQISLGRSVSNVRHFVHDIAIVNGRTFYGFHGKEEKFLKISVYNPNLVKKIEDLLLNGAVMNRVFQPYEGHIPYLLQFFIDYNLYGMNFIHLADMKFRQPVLFSPDFASSDQIKVTTPKDFDKKKSAWVSPIGSPSQTCYKNWHPGNLAQTSLMPIDVERHSTCFLEVDALESDILNKNQIKDSLGTCPGLAAIWEEERQRRRWRNEPTDISPPISQGQRDTVIYETEINYLDEFRIILEERKQRLIQLKSSSESSETRDLESPDLISDVAKTSDLQPNFRNIDFEGSQPIVAANAIQQSSYHSSSHDMAVTPPSAQFLMTTLDDKLVEILAGMASTQDTVSSKSSLLTNGIEEEEDVEANNQLLEDDMNESILMSQHVYDDVDGDNVINQTGKRHSHSVEILEDQGREEEFHDSWSESLLNEIPQIDGTFDDEALVQEKGGIKSDIDEEKSMQSSAKFTTGDLGCRQICDGAVSCNCPSSNGWKNGGKNTKKMVFAQTDGSSDADIWEGDSSPGYKHRKIPLRTYEKSMRTRRQKSRSLSFPCSGSSGKTEKRGKDCTVSTAVKTQGAEGVDDNVRGAYHSEQGSRLFDSESSRVDEKESIFSCAVPLQTKGSIEGASAVPPRRFCSSTKRLSLQRTAIRKLNERKGFSMKSLEFIDSNSSESRSASYSNGKVISFTEIRPSFDKELRKSNSNVIQSNSLNDDWNQVEGISSPSETEHKKGENRTMDTVPDLRFKEVAIKGKESCVQTNLHRSRKAFKLGKICTADLEAATEDEKGELSDSRGSGLSLRDCYVSLTNVGGNERISAMARKEFHNSNSQASEFRKSKYLVSESQVSKSQASKLKASKRHRRESSGNRTYKKARIQSNGDDIEMFFRHEWGVKGGILIGTEKSDNEGGCESCCDSLMKASYPSPSVVDADGPASPPRALSPEMVGCHPELLPTMNVSAPCQDGVATDPQRRCLVEKDSCNVRIRFQHDRSCMQIKPVRLNFDVAKQANHSIHQGSKHERFKMLNAAEGINSESGTVAKSDILHRSAGKFLERCGNRNKFTNVNAGRSDISRNEAHGGSGEQNTEIDKLIAEETGMLAVDSPHSFEYCVEFSPIIDSFLPKNRQQEDNANTMHGKKKGSSSQRLRLRRINSKSSAGEVYRVPDVGDLTQPEISPPNGTDSQVGTSAQKSQMRSKSSLSEHASYKAQATTYFNLPTQDLSAVSVPCSSSRHDALTFGDNDVGGDAAKDWKADESFEIVKSKEVVYAKDSIVLTPEEVRKNLVSIAGVSCEGILEETGRDSDGCIIDSKNSGTESRCEEIDVRLSSFTSVTQKVYLKEDDGKFDMIKDNTNRCSPVTSKERSFSEFCSPVMCRISHFGTTDIPLQQSSYLHRGSSPVSSLHSSSVLESAIRHSMVSSKGNEAKEILHRSNVKGASNKLHKKTSYVQNTDQGRTEHVEESLKRIPSVILSTFKKPPSRSRVLETARLYGLSETRHQKAFFSDPTDLPSRTSIVGGQKLRIKSLQVSKLPRFETKSGFQGALEKFQNECLMNTSLYRDLYHQAKALDINEANLNQILTEDKNVKITPCKRPPGQSIILQWLHEKLSTERKQKKVVHSIELKSPPSLDKIKTVSPINSPTFKSPIVTQSGGKSRSQRRNDMVTESPPFSPAVASSRSLDAASPVSSTPMARTGKPSLRSPVTTRLSTKAIARASARDSPIHLKRTCPDSSQIDGPTPRNSYGFGLTQVNYDSARNEHEIQHLTLLSMELHVRTRRDLCPDPGFDPICAIFYHINCETKSSRETGVFVVDPDSCDADEHGDNKTDEAATAKESAPSVKTWHASEEHSKNSDTEFSSRALSSPNASCSRSTRESTQRKLLHKSGVCDHVQYYYSDEKTMILAFQSFVQSRDPDMLIGYEIQMLSWGYLIDRAKELDFILCPLLSRVPKMADVSKANDDFGKEAVLYLHVNEFKIIGRVLLNVWRIMKSEVTLRVYSFENVAFHLLHQRLPKYSYRTLSSWWSHQSSLHRWRVVDYYVKRCRASVEMLVRTDFITRTSELARLFGILFYSVISRGSQFRVESMMLRIAKPMGFIPVSPSVRQRASMAAPEIIPLVMEPESRFYTDPVIVLDFQSLYPSIIIAYNYCYSTCLGRVKHWNEDGNFKFGATSLSIPTSLFEEIKDDIHISPNGVGFVKSNVRKGILPRMLDDILKTRIMVKNSTKANKENKALYRLLDSRQLGLKLIANVTYGYTSANFSGRMPCVEIADSVVRKGREALEAAIDLINSTKKWNARVVYGDTDSVFILMKGATKKRAFDVAGEIVDAVTKVNPQPMKLKFEKVYMPCILQTKKRYMGYMYETVDQKEAVFDAKGIETVRRDSCAAVSKILERSLKTLFETKDLSLVKKYVVRQFSKILEDRVSIQDFTFAKEYRGMNNYKPGACVPALSIARRLLAHDKRAEPCGGERVPYVIVYGTPGLPLIQLVKRPCELFQDANLRLNGSYYITKQIIPSLNRALSLIGVDVSSWFDHMPRPQRKIKAQDKFQSKRKKGTISQYFSSIQCPICDELTRGSICDGCLTDPQRAISLLSYSVTNVERKFAHLLKLCCHCTGCYDQTNKCISQDCPVFHKLYHVKADRAVASNYRRTIEEMF